MDIKETLIKKLKIKDEELGCSTGSKWFGNGEHISSFSPVDGEIIGKIKTKILFLICFIANMYLQFMDLGFLKNTVKIILE